MKEIRDKIIRQEKRENNKSALLVLGGFVIAITLAYNHESKINKVKA